MQSSGRRSGPRSEQVQGRVRGAQGGGQGVAGACGEARREGGQGVGTKIVTVNTEKHGTHLHARPEESKSKVKNHVLSSFVGG